MPPAGRLQRAPPGPPFVIFPLSMYHPTVLETWFTISVPVVFSSNEAVQRQNVPPAGCLQRGTLTSRGGARVAAKPRPVPASPKPPLHWSGPVNWHTTQPVHTVLARVTRAQPYQKSIFTTMPVSVWCFIIGCCRAPPNPPRPQDRATPPGW